MRRVLMQCIPDAEQKVTAAVKDWGQSIREQLRAETALRLSTSERQVSVPVRITDGVPQPAIGLLDLPDSVLRLVLLRDRIATSSRGVELVRHNLPDVLALLPTELRQRDGIAYEQELASVERLLLALSDRLRAIRLFEDLWRQPVDWLGAYFFRSPRVEIYWMPIAITASTYGIDVEGLTYVVLAHELAHAYTHLGMDIDGQHWRTDRFAESDGYIVEGLAQYYTQVLCERIVTRFPAAGIAFEALLEQQRPGPYADYQRWTHGLLNHGEHIRRTMLHVRNHGVVDYERFLTIVASVDEY